MPRYAVEVRFTKFVTINVWARDEEAAADKAAEIVEDWNDTEDVEATDNIEEIE